MPDDLFQFRWEVASSGYKIVEDLIAGADPRHPTKCKVLTDGVAFGSVYNRRIYYPLQQNSGLFRIFGELDLTEDSICNFANRFGFLGLETSLIGLKDKPTTTSEGKPAHLVGSAEPIANWFNQIDKMKRTLSLWDSARRADKAVLEKSIKWSDDGESVGYQYGTLGQPPSGRSWLASKKQDLAIVALEHFKKGDLIQPAFYCVQKLINEELKTQVSPRLLWEQNWQRLNLYFSPSNLIGALWLQFARSVAGNKEYRRCPECNDWFEISPKVARSDRKFCKDACKVSAYRKRKENKGNKRRNAKTKAKDKK